MLDMPDVSEPSSSPTLPTHPISVNHELTMDITSALLDTRFDVSEVLDALIPPEKQASCSTAATNRIHSAVHWDRLCPRLCEHAGKFSVLQIRADSLVKSHELDI